MMRLVLDTNILVSATLWGGTPQKVLDFATHPDNRVTILTSEPMLEELLNTLTKPKLHRFVVATGKTPNEWQDHFRDILIAVKPQDIPPNIVRDTDDTVVIGTALAGHATHIISGDKDLLVLGEFQDIPILTAQDFLLQHPPPP
jgi:putative PIN family toxin of toxin-antitoxin system